MISTGPFRRALVIANPIAGRGQGARGGRDVAEDLRRRGVASQLHFTRARGDGFDAMIVRALEARRRGPISRASYVVPLLRSLARYRPPRLRVEIDGRAEADDAGLVLISNVVNYAGLLCLSRARRLDDGRFEVFLFREAARRQLLAAAMRAFISELSGKGCDVKQARRVRVTSDTPVPYHVDGDYGGETPVDFRVSEPQYR